MAANRNRPTIAELAARHRLPAIYPFREFVGLGGLMSYGTNLPSMFRRSANYVDRVLKCAKPNELPIEPPTRLGFVANAKTAADLGITLSLGARVTELIR